MNCLDNTNELSIFETKIVMDFYDYHWNSYAKHVHYFGGLVHTVCLIAFLFYVHKVYLYREFEYRLPLLYVMLCCKIYPFIYDNFQIFSEGIRKYYMNPWNYVDQAYLWIGISNIMVQRFVPDITHPASRILMVFQCMILMLKTMFFLRIFDSLSTIVTMFIRVVIDLIPFLLFYGILLVMFACSLAIIDYSNFEFDDDYDIRTVQSLPTGPDREYARMNKMFARVIAVLRISIGDFGFDSTQYMDQFTNSFYWVLFVIICMWTCIIFLNFIIAEVSAKY